MSLLIVDASVAAKWFIQEELSESALSILDNGHQIESPDFLLLEMDSIICKWIRSKSVTLAEGNKLRDSFRQYPIRYHPFVQFLDSAFAIAGETGQSVYDCLYVALAALLEGKMITADRKLFEVMRKGRFGKYLAWVGEPTSFDAR